MAKENNYRQILKSELERRCEKNPRYSLRAFARDLNLGSARLSEILNSVTGLSREKAEKIAERLGFAANQKDFFCTLVEAEHARSKVKRAIAQTRLSKYQAPPFSSLEVDHFKIISDWYHFAILELTEVHGFKSDDRWIANALGLQEIEVKLAIERLMRLGYLERKRKKYVQTKNFAQVSSAVPSEAIRKFHRQILKKALDAIDLQSIDQRDLGAITMSVNTKDLPVIQEKIKSFRKELARFTQANSQRNSLYCFSTQFFELMYKGGSK